MPGRTIEVPIPGGTVAEGTGTGQDQAQRIIATAGTVTIIAGTIDWFAQFAPSSSPGVRSAARGSLFVDSLLLARFSPFSARPRSTWCRPSDHQPLPGPGRWWPGCPDRARRPAGTRRRPAISEGAGMRLSSL